VAAPGIVALIDPIRLGDIRAFWELVLDPAVETVVHSGRQDLEICHLWTGSAPAGIYDVQVAAGLVGLPYPLAYGKLVDQVLGLQLDQGETYTDWARRPLSRSQLLYALEDVLYLLPLRDRLDARLVQLSRTQWLRDELAALEDPETFTRELEEPWLKVRGRGNLPPRGQAVLRELAVWREQAARTRNVPARTFLRDDALTELARRMPTTINALRAARNFPRHEIDEIGRDVLDAIGRGKAVPEDRLPPPPAEREDRPAARMLADLAAAVGQSLCLREKVSHDLFAAKADYLELADAVLDGVGPTEAGALAADAGDTRDVPRLLSGWRGRFAGKALTEALTGKLRLRVTGGGTEPSVELEG
jgi:ribonuclease D